MLWPATMARVGSPPAFRSPARTSSQAVLYLGKMPGESARGAPSHRLRSIDPWLVVGIAAFFALIVVALFGERLAPNDPIYFVVEHGSDPRPYDPGIVFPFGSDVLGRDLVSLVLAGAGTTLAIVAVGGAARVTAGTFVAALGLWWRPMRLVSESVAELVSAIPAT